MSEDNQKRFDLPKNIAEPLIIALQNLSFFLHDKMDASHVLLDIHHISDATLRCSSTIIAGGGGGFKLNLKDKREKDRQEFVKSDASKLAEDAIERAISAAKGKSK